MDNIYAIATATAKKAGYSDFDEGSEGEKKREEIVLALKRRGMKKADDTREAARYQARKPKPTIMEQREPADIPEKDPNRVKQGKWVRGKWQSKALQELWKATYGANNDQARKVGQRTHVRRNPRLNPNKLGVSDIINKARNDNPRKKPNIVAQGRENDLYPTGSQFAADVDDKSSGKKKFPNEKEDNEHQLAVGRRDGETDKPYSPAGSTLQAEHVGAVSKAILKQGLLDILLQKKDEDWPHKRFTREEAEKIANSRGLRSAADVTQRSIDEENELEGDAQARLRSKKNTRRRKARKARKNEDKTTTVEDTIPSPEEKTQSQMEFDDNLSENKGDGHNVDFDEEKLYHSRGGSKPGSRAQKLIPPGDWKPDSAK